ncbi:MAG: RDD family protein [Cyclobacteriaceae bacterium]
MDKLRYASFSSRLLAHNIDLLIMIILLYLVGLIITDNQTLYYIAIAVYFIYHISFESSSLNATPGKILTKITVEAKNRTSLSFAQIVSRNLLKVLSLLLLFTGFIMISFSSKRQGLHDYLSNSYVFRLENNN